ncbi:MAG: hypothetical protein RLY78_409 [Pseudomonadota bacterium]
MYEAHFRLQRPPFSIAPDPRALYLSEPHREALAHLGWGLRGGSGGIVLLTGEIGAGKTTLCRCLLEQAPARCRIAYIYNPRLSVRELLQAVCEEFGLQVEAGGDGLKGPIDTLNRFLLDGHAAGQQAVLVIDEAQNLSIDLLEQLRLLTNLETSERKLLQIVLVGQPELRQMVARPELAQLAQRIVARCHLGALDERQTLAYVAHRMTVAGASGPLPFDAPALRLVHRLSAGLPRRINLLCDRALLGAWAHGRAVVDAEVVRRAAAEVIGDPAPAAGLRLSPLRAARGLGLGPAPGAGAGAGAAGGVDLDLGGGAPPGPGGAGAAGGAGTASPGIGGRRPAWAAGLAGGFAGTLCGGALLLAALSWWTGGAWPPRGGATVGGGGGGGAGAVAGVAGPAGVATPPAAATALSSPADAAGTAAAAGAVGATATAARAAAAAADTTADTTAVTTATGPDAPASPPPASSASGIVGAMPASALWGAPAASAAPLRSSPTATTRP